MNKADARNEKLNAKGKNLQMIIYNYYPNTAHGEVNQLKKEELKVNGTLAHYRQFDYFPDGNLKESREMGANNLLYSTTYAYDAYMRLTEVRYPNISLSYGYNNYNDLISISDVETNTILWQKNQEAVDGRPLENNYGNGYINQQSYDNWLQLSMIKSIKPGTPNLVALHQQYNFELGSNNLLSRTTVGVGSEIFGYDNLNRLTSINEIIGATNTPKIFEYEDNGNLTEQQIGTSQTLEYTSARPHAITNHRFTLNQPVPPSSAETHNYTYTDFNSISEISQAVLNSPTAQPHTLQISYGVDQQRIKMEYVSPSTAYASTTFYIGSANMELRGEAEFTYLYDGYGAPFAIQRKTGETKELFYLHLDHLGSLMAISDELGNIVERRSYDAWGRHRHPTTWNYTIANPFGMGGSNDITLRGFTFHEHLPHFSLINMNGRLYDYVLGRMLSPDNYVQSPNSTQSFNRYSYCWNNPLKYTDPSGEIVFAPIIIGALAGGFGGWRVGQAAGATGWQMFGYIATGAGIGAITGGVGTGVSALGGGAIGTGITSGVVGGAGFSGLQSNWDPNAMMQGAIYGAISGGVGAGAGAAIGGGLGSFTGGSIGSGINTALHGGKIKDMAMSSIGGGIMAFGLYHASTYISWQYEGGKSWGPLKISYKQFNTMQADFQRSRFWGREYGGFLLENGGISRAKPGSNSQIDLGIAPNDAIAEYHTHWDKPGETRDIISGGDGNYVNPRNIAENTPVGQRVLMESFKTARYHGNWDFNTNGKPSIVINRYDGSYYPGYGGDYSIITPPINRFIYSYIFWK